jgi:hypothetical protein
LQELNKVLVFQQLNLGKLKLPKAELLKHILPESAASSVSPTIRVGLMMAIM